MHILLINQFFHPDSAPTAQLLGDLAGTLTDWGHTVTVICGQPGYSANTESSAPNVQLIRIGNKSFSSKPAARLLSYATFLGGALRAAGKVRRPDIIVTLTTPPFVSLVGTLLKRRYRSSTRHYIWEMDLYPDVAADVGLLERRAIITRVLSRFANFQRRRADGVIALGDCMRRRLESQGISRDRIQVCENWSDSRIIRPIPFPENDVLRILYSGNFGLAHELSTIEVALERLQCDARFQFTFSGGGSRRAELRKFCTERGLHNVSFLPYHPEDRLSALLGSAHIGLVTQRAECAGSVVPSKVYGLMAAHRPILYIGPKSATPAQLIQRFGCGWQIDPGDSQGLIQLLEQLASSPQLIRRAGERAGQAFDAHYDRPAGVARMAKVLGINQPSRVCLDAVAAATNDSRPRN